MKKSRALTDADWLAACDWMEQNWTPDVDVRSTEIAQQFGLDQGDVKLFCWLNSLTPDEAKPCFRRGRVLWDKAVDAAAG